MGAHAVRRRRLRANRQRATADKGNPDGMCNIIFLVNPANSSHSLLWTPGALSILSMPTTYTASPN